VERYIGLDVHTASTTVAVIGESGKRLGSHVVETNGQALVEQLKTIPGTRHVVLEEGTQSAWIYEILSPHAEEVLVTMIPESRGQKSDESDGFKLAEQLRTGGIKKHVFKEVGEYRTLRELARTHAIVVQDVVRVQNRIKALLRSRGVAVSGKGVYSEQGREECLQAERCFRQGRRAERTRGLAARTARRTRGEGGGARRGVVQRSPASPTLRAALPRRRPDRLPSGRLAPDPDRERRARNPDDTSLSAAA
jgi:hypothetical protein